MNQQRSQARDARDQEIRALTRRLYNVREEERARISRDVHDGLGQLLTALKMDVQWIAKRVGGPAIGSAELGAKLADAEALVDRSIETVQRIAVEMRPSVLDALGLAAALRDEARRFAERTGVTATWQTSDTSQVSPEAATAFFRICQEMLTNVARHANASTVRVVFEDVHQAWVLRVEDDGVGLRGVPSLGVLGMRERAESLGGTFSLAAGTARGTVAEARVPRPVAGQER